MTADPLLRAIIERPDDDDARLVYADWLQQHGDPRGELIAIQLANDPALAPRARELIAAHDAAWTAALGEGVSKVEYARGLPCAATVELSGDMLDVLDRAPIHKLRLDWNGNDEDADADAERLSCARALARDPRLARVRELSTGLPWGEPAFGVLLASPHLAGLRALAIADPDSRAYAARALVATKLTALESLWFCGDWRGDLGDAGVAILATANLPALRHLGLLNVQCGPAAMQSLADSTTIASLATLDLGWGSYEPNRIGPAGAIAIASSPRFARLERLVLDHNAIGDPGLAALAGSEHLGRLAMLSLTGNAITDDGLRALATGTGMPALATLELTFNRGITGAGVEALAASPRLASLHTLWLRQCPIGPAGAVALARSPHAAGLRDLNLLECTIGDEGADAIARSESLAGLATLQLSANRLSEGTKQRLRDRFGSRVTCDR